jgi:hypothetical protein
MTSSNLESDRLGNAVFSFWDWCSGRKGVFDTFRVARLGLVYAAAFSGRLTSEANVFRSQGQGIPFVHFACWRSRPKLGRCGAVHGKSMLEQSDSTSYERRAGNSFLSRTNRYSSLYKLKRFRQYLTLVRVSYCPLTLSWLSLAASLTEHASICPSYRAFP